MNISKVISTILIISTLISITSCTREIREQPQEITFAITGNTAPESPFVGFIDTLPQLIEEINRENPLLVVHTGNFIHGGFDWMGLKEEDITRQFGFFKKATEKLNPLLYHVAGSGDLFNNNPSFFEEFTRKQVNYSFNYSTIHFIVFNIIHDGTVLPSFKESLAWLRKDLKTYQNSSMVFIFTHNALYGPPPGKKCLEHADEIHQLLKKYPVQAVFSGNSPQFFAVKKDGISYINAGCGGFLRKERYRNYCQYYIVTCKDDNFTIHARKITFFDNNSN